VYGDIAVLFAAKKPQTLGEYKTKMALLGPTKLVNLR